MWITFGCYSQKGPKVGTEKENTPIFAVFLHLVLSICTWGRKYLGKKICISNYLKHGITQYSPSVTVLTLQRFEKLTSLDYFSFEQNIRVLHEKYSFKIYSNLCKILSDKVFSILLINSVAINPVQMKLVKKQDCFIP